MQAQNESTAPVVLVERHEAGYAVVTLNRPASLNALSHELRSMLADTFEELEADAGVRAVILTGNGRGFCAGLDLKELAAGKNEGQERPRDPVAAIGRFSGPVIGAINGVAITGGFELALACDVLIVSEEARFADTHARVGIMPGWGLSQKLSRAIGIYRAKELSLSGNFLSAAQADAWGLVNRVVPADQLLPQARQLAEDMLSANPDMLVAYKKNIDDGFAMNFGDGMKLERERADAANRSYATPGVVGWQDTVRNRGRAQTGGA